MLNITPVNFLKNNYLTKKSNIVTAPKLKPLAYDTVSFSGARSLNHSLKNAFDNMEICEEIYSNAEVPEENLRKMLKSVLSDLISSKSNPDGLIGPIATRRKSPESIREKATSVFEEAIIKHDTNNFINLNKAEDIKKAVHDIVGARIIINRVDKEKNSVIIERLISLVKSGKLKIKEIELLTPPNDEGIKPYFEDYDLERLKKEVNKQGKYHIEKIKKTPSPSGYSALHLDIDLHDDNIPSKNAGFEGEIQIIGTDVAYFKDLEDCCYKIKQDKNIKGGHPAYYPFIKHLKKWLYGENDKINEKNKELFDEYTHKAYIIQRKKDPQAQDYNRTHLPTIAECGMQGVIPSEFDFNYLQRIKEYCDKLCSILNKKY